MKVSSVNSGMPVHMPSNQNFKSVYPVYHWVSDSANFINNGQPAMTAGVKLTKKLQGKLVRILNSWKPLSVRNLEDMTFEQNLVDYIAKYDRDFCNYPQARTFYNKNGGYKDGKYEPIAYLVTGKDVSIFEQLGKKIGKIKGQEPYKGTKIRTAELNIASGNYNSEGLKYVKSRAYEFVRQIGNHLVPYGLHIHFKTRRNANGVVKNYILDGNKFVKENWTEPPYRAKYVQASLF